MERQGEAITVAALTSPPGESGERAGVRGGWFHGKVLALALALSHCAEANKFLKK